MSEGREKIEEKITVLKVIKSNNSLMVGDTVGTCERQKDCDIWRNLERKSNILISPYGMKSL